MLGKLENRNHFSYTNIYLTIAIISLIFVSALSITAGISNAQTYTSPAPLVSENNSSNIIIITSNSNSTYSIPSTFVKVDRFNTNYTIAGKISSLKDSRDLITSTIVDDFDKNPNIGYVKKNGISSTTTTTPPQFGLPNPFVSEDLINQKITNEIHNAIAAVAASSATEHIEKNVEIKCAFGMVLSEFKCS
jgi:hypothetical protein